MKIFDNPHFDAHEAVNFVHDAKTGLRGILYVPDFAINAGGIISVSREIAGVDNVDWVAERMRQLDANIAAILAEAEAERVSPHHIATRFAERRLSAAGE